MSRDPRTPWLVLGLVLALATPVLGGAASPPVVSVTADALVVTPADAYDYLSLRVSGPDGRTFQVDGTGGPVAFRPFGIPDYVPPDGSYVWEVILTPQDAVDPELFARALRARESGDARAETALRMALHRAIVVQSGAFGILDGKLIGGGAGEPAGRPGKKPTRGTTRSPFGPASLEGEGDLQLVDQVIPDDLIVQGSLCVGFDCVNNENFGFDTIRLKENNLRIRFDDTSTAAGFPSRDWQLTANDSASGGASKFSIEDITGARVPFTITAGATTNSIFVDGTGRVGFRTSTPVLDLHVATSNTPAARLEQNSSGGFTAQTWDVAGNEANFFVRDVTGGSRLPFRIRPGAPTSSLDIAADGDVGIGTGSPNARLHVFGSETTDIFAGFGPHPEFGSGPGLIVGYGGTTFGRGAGFLGVRPDALAAAPNPSLRFLVSDSQKMMITNAGFLGLGTNTPGHPVDTSAALAAGAHLTAGGIWTNGSSREFKTDIVSLSRAEAVAALQQLTPVKYASTLDPTERHVGFVAEDVPDLVATKDRKGLSPMDIVAVLTRVVKEQQASLDAQQQLIAELAAKVAALEAAPAR